MTTQGKRTSWLATLLSQRSVQIIIGVWIVSILIGYLLGADGLPIDRPNLEGTPIIVQIVILPVIFIVVLLPIFLGVTYFVTRKRTIPDLASRAPERSIARRETLLLLAYGAVMLVLGQIVGRIIYGEGIGFHLHGSIGGPTADITPGAVIGWSAYNFVAYALIPYVVFRRRGYDHEALNLKSSDVKNDTIVILVVLSLGILLDLASGGLLELTGSQLLVGMPLTFVVHLFGTALPTLMFLTILLPRYLKLTGSTATMVILGGLTYAALHIFEYWAVYDTVGNGILSVILVFQIFIGPGVIKSFLFLRTGNAWVHVWAFHVISPHVTLDTPNIVQYFRLK